MLLMLVYVMFEGADVRSTDGRRMFGSSHSNTEKDLIMSMTCKSAAMLLVGD